MEMFSHVKIGWHFRLLASPQPCHLFEEKIATSNVRSYDKNNSSGVGALIKDECRVTCLNKWTFSDSSLEYSVWVTVCQNIIK